jgi:hypothetical protein
VFQGQWNRVPSRAVAAEPVNKEISK